MERNLPVLHDALSGAGNLKTAVHKDVKGQFGAVLTDAGLELTPNGDYAMAVADASGKTVYVRVSAVVTLNDPFVEKVKKPRAKKEAPEVVVPKLFG